MIDTLPNSIVRGRSAKLTQYMFVASGILQARASAAISSLPATGSS
jgi:hypothetical protein